MRILEIRKNELLNWLAQERNLSVDQIAKRFEISLPSARRLCTQLSDEGRLVRVHGGVRILPQQMSYSFDLLSQEHQDEKIRIARYASSLVESRQVIFLESGTTLRQFSIALAERIRRQEIKDITIITNSLVNLESLYPVTKVMMLGGEYRNERKDFAGYIAELSLKRLKFEYCFIGADGISINDGVMTTDVDTLRFDAELVKHTEKVVVLAHSVKFQKQSFMSFIPVNECHCLITDVGLPEETKELYRNQNVKVICV